MESKQRLKRLLSLAAPLLTLFLGFAVTRCAPPPRIPAATAVDLPSEALREGRLLFLGNCSSCHPGGRAGLGPSIINKPLPKIFIRFQTRAGLGVMPAFKDHVLTDREVKRIAEYLDWLKD